MSQNVEMVIGIHSKSLIFMEFCFLLSCFGIAKGYMCHTEHPKNEKRMGETNYVEIIRSYSAV